MINLNETYLAFSSKLSERKESVKFNANPAEDEYFYVQIKRDSDECEVFIWPSGDVEFGVFVDGKATETHYEIAEKDIDLLIQAAINFRHPTSLNPVW